MAPSEGVPEVPFSRAPVPAFWDTSCHELQLRAVDWELLLGGVGFIWVGGVWVAIITRALRRRDDALTDGTTQPAPGFFDQFTDPFSNGYLRFSRALSVAFVGTGVLMIGAAFAAATSELG